MLEIGTVLVLGAYGLAGREIVDSLLAKTDLAVIASGRNVEKLEALTARLAHTRLSTRLLDAYDAGALAKACSEADLVINAVGPYAVGGAEIARTVLDSGLPYVDFANEQSRGTSSSPLSMADNAASTHERVISISEKRPAAR